MSTPGADWTAWSASWQTATAPVPRETAGRLAREPRRLTSGLAEAVVAAAAILGIALALSHAPNFADLVHGGLVIAIISAVLLIRVARQRQEPGLAEATTTFLSLALRSRQRQLQFVHFVWALAALELAFLVPWWIGGYRVHGAMVGPLALVTAWLPLGVIAAVLVWTVRLRSRIRQEFEVLRAIQDQLRETG